MFYKIIGGHIHSFQERTLNLQPFSVFFWRNINIDQIDAAEILFE